MEGFKVEIQFILLFLKVVGNLPSKNWDGENFEASSFDIFSFESFYCFFIYMGLAAHLVNKLWVEMSMVRNFYTVALLLCRLSMMFGCTEMPKLLLKIEQFDNGVEAMTGKRPFAKDQRKRCILWTTVVAVLMSFNTVIWLLCYGNYETVLFFFLLNGPVTIYVALYMAICAAFYKRLNYTGCECRLIFDEMRFSSFNDLNSVLPLMKIRHLHMSLLNALNSFNEIFSNTNVMYSIIIYIYCMYSFGYTRAVQLEFVEQPAKVTLLAFYVLCARSISGYFFLSFLNYRLGLEVCLSYLISY